MPISLTPITLLSRVIRTNASNGVRGGSLLNPTTGSALPRTIRNLTKLGGQQEQGGPLSWIWDGAKAIAGFIGGLIKGIAFSASAIWGWLTNAINQLKAFNWNATDQQLQQSLNARNLTIAQLWGGVVGQGFGWLAGISIGYGISYLVPVIGGAGLARMVSTAAGREMIEELLPQITNALAQTAGALAQNALTSAYINYRKFLKAAPDSLLNAIFGNDAAYFIKRVWGNEGGPDMSFNTQMDEFVESIENDALQAFLEEFFDEAWDGFTESGFVIAQQIDDAFAQHKASQQKVLGPERTVEIQLDANNEDEVINLMAMPQQLAFPAVQNAITTFRQIYNRDIGEVVGQPATEWARARPQLRQLTILFRDRPRPPWRHLNGKRCREATYAIPDCKTGLTWQQIKNAANSFTWGKYRATAQLNNQRQMAVYGSTETEAKQKLRELLTLSTAEILTLSVTQEEDRPAALKKEPTLMYPAYATLLSRRNSIDSQGRVMIDNRVLDEEVIRIPLWLPSEPPNLPPLG